jgi:hypothetical protein
MSREIFDKEQKEKYTCWRSIKLKCLGVEPKAKTERRDSGRLAKLTKSLKQTMNQKYEVDYSVNVKEEFLNRRDPLSKVVIEGTFKE